MFYVYLNVNVALIIYLRCLEEQPHSFCTAPQQINCMAGNAHVWTFEGIVHLKHEPGEYVQGSGISSSALQ